MSKITAEKEGYSKKNALKIVAEYNEWVRKKNEAEFKNLMIFGKVIAGSLE